MGQVASGLHLDFALRGEYRQPAADVTCCRMADAQARRSSAKAMYQVARANLRRAMGLPQFSESLKSDKEKQS